MDRNNTVDNNNGAKSSNGTAVEQSGAATQSSTEAPMKESGGTQQSNGVQQSSGQQSIVPKTKLSPKTRNLIIILSVIFGVLLILGILAIVLLPQLLKVDYESAYDIADDLNDVRFDAESWDSCGGVIGYVDSSYQKESDYESYVSTCKEDLSEFKTGVEELAKNSAVQRDGGIREKWDKFKTSYDAAFPAYESLIGIYADWHAFVAKWASATEESDWWKTVTEDKVKTWTESLTNSTNEALKSFGEGYVSARWKQIDAYQKYQSASDAYYEASYSASNKTELRNQMNAAREVYQGADDDYDEYLKQAPDMEDTKALVGVDLDKNENQFFSKYGDLYSEISKKYFEYELGL